MLRFSIPASGGLRALAIELAVKLAAQLGVKTQGDGGVAHAVEDLARRVNAFDGDDVVYEFHKLDRELKIEARSNGRSSETRIPLPA